MSAQIHEDYRTLAWKELVTQLPGILGVEFSLENGAIREVHILSDQSRNPKQIVRDVQSAMLARFQVELDHRVISVAQVPGAIAGSRGRLICDRLELTTGRDGSSAAVHLLLEDKVFIGKAKCDLTTTGRLRSIALATVDALNQLPAPGSSFSVEEVRSTALGEHQAMLVGLLLKSGGKTEALLGACYEGEDSNFSVVMATLDAVNRRLPTLPRADSTFRNA